MPNTPPSPGDSPFSWVAYILFEMRNSLEEREPGRLPRWVRICRGGEHREGSEAIASAIGTVLNGVSEMFPALQELALDLEEMLYQVDSAAALTQVLLDGFTAAFDEDVERGLRAFLGTNYPEGISDALRVLRTIGSTGSDALDYVPSPEDVWSIGHQVYRLLCVVNEDFPRNGDDSIDTGALGDEEHMVLNETGKIRLCMWSYSLGLSVNHVNEGEKNGEDDADAKDVELYSLGSRRMFEQTAQNTPAMAETASMKWNSAEGDVRLFKHQFTATNTRVDHDIEDSDDERTGDLKEVIELLKNRGFGTGNGSDGKNPDVDGQTHVTDDLTTVLKMFQVTNELPITGEIDNHSLNRLLNLDFERKNVRRAKRYDDTIPMPADKSGFLKLVNPGADKFDKESLRILRKNGSRYGYYVVPRSNEIAADAWTEGQGWISDNSSNTLGFVAIQSRLISPKSDSGSGYPETGRFDGGRWSEGDSATGRYFWSARHTEPWKPGRSGTPNPQGEALFGGTRPAANAVTRMYQWIPVNSLQAPGGGFKLQVFATAMQRSLFSDRGGNGLPDQGRFRLEAYEGSTDTKRPRGPGLLGTVSLGAFPDHADMPFIENPGSHPVWEIDNKRAWYFRKTPILNVPENTTMLCLVVEGVYQSAFDIDAYFDDFRVGYNWKKE